MSVTITINNPAILNRVTNPQFGLIVSHEWKRLIDPYTPRETSQLMYNVSELPFKLHYHSVYAHYQYTGIVYVDPKNGVSGWYDPIYGWWSRKGITKVPSNRQLQYKTGGTNRNPFATDHWDQKAAAAGQLNKLYQTINEYLKTH